MAIILSAAVCKFHDALRAQSGTKRLAVIAAHNVEEHGAASEMSASSSSASVNRLQTVGDDQRRELSIARTNRPTMAEMIALVERGADFKHSRTDHINIEQYVLHYSICMATPFSALCDDVVYLCLVENSTITAQSTFHTDIAQQFLGVLQNSVSSDPALVHAVTLPFLHAQEYIQPRFVEIVMTANQTIYADYKQNLMRSASGASSGMTTQPSDQVTQLQKQVQEVKTIMSDNVVRIMERGERLDNLDSRTEALNASSQNFKTTARRVQRNMCMKNLKWTIVLVAFLTIFGAFALYTILREMGVFGGGK